MRLRAIVHMLRPGYLLPILAIFTAVRMGIVYPVFRAAELPDPLTWPMWTCLLLACLLVAAGSSVINDYFDQQEDRTVRPEVVAVGRYLSRRQAIRLHSILSFLAILLAVYPSLAVGRIAYVLFFPVSAGLFWFYSTLYKDQFLVGNLQLAFMAFALPFVMVAYQVQAVEVFLWREVAFHQLSIEGMWSSTLAYGVALGLLVLSLTLVRNCRHFASGADLGAETLPVRMGMRSAKLTIAIGLFVLMLAFLLAGAWVSIAHPVTAWRWAPLAYSGGAVCLPLLIACFNLLVSEKAKQFRISEIFILTGTWALILYPLAQVFLLS
ncbi:MAG: hypothetical protein CSA07_01215 [Bacteroidia bacterium]|nr:MAG: hypothetical protein CSA07_01215 [Bacteroidia bacterium]